MNTHPQHSRQDPEPARPARRPVLITAAGVLWLLTGLSLLGVAGVFVLAAVDAEKGSLFTQGEREQMKIRAVVNAGVYAVMGVALAVVGGQTLTGAVSAVKAKGVRSIVFAVLLFLVSVSSAAFGSGPLTLGFILAVLSLAAGVLAIKGASDFRKWQAWNQQEQMESLREWLPLIDNNPPAGPPPPDGAVG